MTTSPSFSKVSRAAPASSEHKSSLIPIIPCCSPTIASLSFCKATRSPSSSSRAHIAPSSSRDPCLSPQGCAANSPNGDVVIFRLIQRIKHQLYRTWEENEAFAGLTVVREHAAEVRASLPPLSVAAESLVRTCFLICGCRLEQLVQCVTPQNIDLSRTCQFEPIASNEAAKPVSRVRDYRVQARITRRLLGNVPPCVQA